jgi:L-histidine N-alpha-methyltransferase
MNSINAAATDRITMEVNLPPGGPLSGMAADVRAGLTSPFKELSPRYFYDELGSELFERITELDEYYPTRCERQILQGESESICEAANRPASLIELGSGSARKTRVLLDAMRGASCLETYCPVDISEEITRETAEAIAAEYEDFNVHGLVCDFEFDLERVPVEGPRVIALLGGTVGNFAPHQRAGFLRRISNLLGPEDRFLLGTDLVKDPAILEAAYNDSEGVTAEFNKNVWLSSTGSSARTSTSSHSSTSPVGIRRTSGWISGCAPSRTRWSTLDALDMLVPFGAGEEMRTEISTKFLRPGLEGIYAEAGLGAHRLVDGPRGPLRLSLARASSSSS